MLKRRSFGRDPSARFVALVPGALLAAACSTEDFAACGDGQVDGSEECDDGNKDDTDACKSDCTLPECGDGILQKGAGEECDDANLDDNDSCLNSCKVARCGDGVLWAGVEPCDDGNDKDDDGCTTTCKLPSCGDGVVQAGEECDDGNVTDDDACTTQCTLPRCGDGVVQAGEECDDANTSDADACVSGCKKARCGDGMVWAGVELCDDGNQDETDGCTSSCAPASCGDGVVQASEQCDDGNLDDQDDCTTKCVLASCGDGVVRVHAADPIDNEMCDDANKNDYDGCSSLCGPGCNYTTPFKFASPVACYFSPSQTGAVGPKNFWPQARQSCVTNGGHLPKIDDGPDHTFVLDLLVIYGVGAIWLGLNDEAIEASWQWDLGLMQPQLLGTFAPWVGNIAPASDVFKNCVMMYGDGGEWDDLPCQQDGFFANVLCERSLKPPWQL
jgi:cysteine-rich repeat protein